MERIILTICFILLLQGCSTQKSISPLASSSSTANSEDNKEGSSDSTGSPKNPPTNESCDGLDCNYCANNVQDQFSKAANKINWSKHIWNFTWPQSYSPMNLKPVDLFDGIEKDAHEFNIPDKHIQGFTRTNSKQFPYAGSHSHTSGTSGGIFVVENKSGQLFLSTLHQTKTAHPSDVHIIGKDLIYADKVGQQLVFMDLNSTHHSSKRSYTIENPLFGGGVGIAKVSDGKYLVITTGPGSQDSRDRFHHFYELSNTQLSFLGRSKVSIPPTWDEKFKYSEGLSVVTECGSKDIYAIHTTGDQDPLGMITGNGYWRLSKLESTNGVLNLKPIHKLKTNQNMSDCSVRASGTVTVTKDHLIEFHCHGYAKEPDGANVPFYGYVLGPPKDKTKDPDSFSFKKGSPSPVQ